MDVERLRTHLAPSRKLKGRNPRLNQYEARHFHFVFSSVRNLCATKSFLSKKRCSDQSTRSKRDWPFATLPDFSPHIDGRQL